MEYLLPHRGRYLQGENTTQNNDGRKKSGKIINGSPLDAIRTLPAGLHSGLTSPSRPWFQLTLPDESLAEYEPVRNWLHDVRQAMLTIFARSNFYGAIHSLYSELGGFGTNVMLIEEDPVSVIRCRPFTIGEYCLSLDSNYRPESLYRQFSMTAGQMREKFGEDNLPVEVKNALTTNKLDARFEVVHVVEKSQFVQSGKLDHRGMEFSSVYFPLAGSQDLILRTSGYRTIPFVAPRWEVFGVDTYGISPAMLALGDMKMLQKMETMKLKGLDKMIDPPMNAPVALRGKGTVVAGGVNYIDVAQGMQGFTPSYQVKPDFQDIAFEIDRVERRIKQFFYNDLFLAIIGQEKTMTAAEVAKRYEEKLMMLGPVLERLQSELMDPIIDRVFSIMQESNLLPPVPREMPPGMAINVEYISLLAQAQKMVGSSGIEQLVGFTANLAKVSPDILDKVDFDEAVDQYGGMLGVPPKIIRSDDKVAMIRESKAKQAKAAQMAAMAPQLARGVKDLASAPSQGGNSTVLDSLTQAAGAMRGGAPVPA